MPVRLFQSLEIDWLDISARADQRDHINTWRLHPALAGLHSVGEAVPAVHEAHPDTADEILGALIRHAPIDTLAARTVLQCLIPGLRNLALRYRQLADPDDVDGAVASQAWERIHTYPLDRRPRAIAANMIGDVRKHLAHRLGVAARCYEIPSATITSVGQHPGEPIITRADELLDIVASAVRSGQITPAEARLIVATRITDITLNDLALADAIPYSVVRKRRYRAERRLRECAA